MKVLIMKVLLDVRDEKAAFFLEILKNFKFVTKAQPLSPYKAEIFEGLKEAISQVNLAKEGKIKLKSARSLLNEL